MTATDSRAIGQVKGPPDHYWEDLQEGDQLKTTGITFTEAHLIAWAGLTGDIVRFHLDAEYADSTPFGERVAHGPFTLSVALGLLTQTGYFGNVLAWLGLDEVRATRPVVVGDTIRAEATLEAARTTSKPGSGIWSFRYVVKNQRDEQVMTFVSSFLVQRSDAVANDASSHSTSEVSP